AAAELALGLSAVGATGLRSSAIRFAVDFWPVRSLAVAALAVAVASFRTMRRVTLSPMRMTLLAIVAVAALLAIVATVGLGRGSAGCLCLWRRLQPLEPVEDGGEIGRERRNRDTLARRPFDVAQIAALLRTAESDG